MHNKKQGDLFQMNDLHFVNISHRHVFYPDEFSFILIVIKDFMLIFISSVFLKMLSFLINLPLSLLSLPHDCVVSFNFLQSGILSNIYKQICEMGDKR